MKSPWPSITGPSIFSQDPHFCPRNAKGQTQSQIASQVVSEAVARGETPGTIDRLNGRNITSEQPAEQRPTRS